MTYRLLSSFVKINGTIYYCDMANRHRQSSHNYIEYNLTLNEILLKVKRLTLSDFTYNNSLGGHNSQ